MTLSSRLRYLATVDGRIARASYLAYGAVLMALKYLIDVVLVQVALGRWWLPTAYVSSLGTLTALLRGAPGWLLPVMGLITLPFIWFGVTLSVRRALDAGRSPWLALLFFVPMVNYALIALLLVLPTRDVRASEHAPARLPARSLPALRAMLPGLALGALMIAWSVYVVESYGVALFFATPFTIGAVTAYLLNRDALVTQRETQKVVLLTHGVLAGMLILIGREGALCIAMAIPLATILGAMGAVLGRQIAAGTRRGGGLQAAGMGMIALPLAAFLEPHTGGAPVLHEVRSSVVIAASPMTVWSQVIAFPPIPEPDTWFFRLGIAYPKYARIEGSGVGAVRYCVFSTGPFVEPITVWEPGRRLAFDVTSSPVPLRELTPYANVAPPHLTGFLLSRRGEFRLIAQPDGTTRLEGSTWYTVAMGPEAYWQLFGDYLIHAIHGRVLQHVRTSAEALERPQG